MSQWPKAPKWTEEQAERMEARRSKARREWEDRQKWRTQWWEREERKEEARGSADPAPEAPPKAAEEGKGGSRRRERSQNKIPTYWRLAKETREEAAKETVARQGGGGPEGSEDAEESLPPPLYDPTSATDDMAHHRDKAMTPSSFAPQRHVLIALGRPVLVLSFVPCPAGGCQSQCVVECFIVRNY